MKKVAVILTGSGFQDGAEITESVSSLIALAEAKVEATVFAPELSFQATDHLTGDSSEKDTRQAMAEAARISRGRVKNLSQLKADDYDALVLPGGFGVAQHLCTWAQDGANCDVLSDAERVIQDFHQQSKPIGAWCIAPALVAKVLGSHRVSVTIGEQKEVAQEIEKTGAQHVNCSVDDFVTDRENKVITTPAYMYDGANAFEVFTGIRKATQELVNMA